MYERPCPTGSLNKAISPFELDLPPSRLPDTPENKNNHHLYWEYKKLGQFLVPRTFRDLAHNQVVLMRDYHTSLHKRFGPPPLPSFGTMMEEIEIAYEMDEPIHYQEDRQGPYITRLIGAQTMQNIYHEYNKINPKAA